MFHRLVRQESGYNPRVTSKVGAYGLGQLMDGAVTHLGGDTERAKTDWRYNLQLSARYLRWCLRQTGDTNTALMAYNWGIGNVRKWQRGEATPPSETVNYVKNVGD